MEQTALPFVSRSQPPPPSTLAPPPLETAATGTRALQRFDIGRMRAVTKPVAGEPSEATASEASEAPSPSQAPSPSHTFDVIVRTAPWPRFDMPATRGATRKMPRFWPMPAPTPRAPQPFATVRDAAWALAAAASLAVAGSFASALVYLIAFP